jgi:hypothetical protein
MTEPGMFIDRVRYLRKTEVAHRYAMTTKSVTRLLNHPDAARRLPPATLVIGATPYWSVDDLDQFDVEQIELSRHRQVKRPAEEFIYKPGQARRATGYKKEGA